MESTGSQSLAAKTLSGPSLPRGFLLGMAVILGFGLLFSMARSFYVDHWVNSLQSDQQYQDAVMLGRGADRAAVNERIQEAYSRTALFAGIVSVLFCIAFVLVAVVQIKQDRRRFGLGMLLAMGICLVVSLALVVSGMTG
jgi:uncharacterized membrane protein YcjF (UPF0283 family)